jgi:hypothetical protein
VVEAALNGQVMVELLQRRRLDRFRLAFALARVPPGPAREIENRHMRNAGGSDNERVIAVGAGEAGFRRPADCKVAEGPPPASPTLASRGLIA